MSPESTQPDPERQKRDLRLRIGRLRRRIDGRVRAAGQSGRELFSWRTYVKGLPGAAIVGAVGAGMALSAGLSRRRLARWLGFFLIRRASKRFGHVLCKEAEQIWKDSAPDRKPHRKPRGAADEQR